MFNDFFRRREEEKGLGARIKAAMTSRMNDTDKARIRVNLAEYARMRPIRHRVLNRERRSWTSVVFHPLPVFTLSLLVVMSGTAGAAELALPGDFLYPIKININEEVRVALATTPQAKATVAIERAETRLKELETLETRGDIDEETRDEIEERLDSHVRVAEEQALEIDDENGSRAPREHRLVAVLRAHETLLANEHIGIGGSLEAAIPAEEAPTPDMDLAATLTSETALMVATSDEGTTSETSFARGATRTTSPSPAPAKVPQPKDKKTSAEKSEKKEMSGFNEKTVGRQKKAAEQRIDALRKLLDRLEKRVSADAYASASTSFETALGELEQGEEAQQSENRAEASFHFNIALKTAIDARELLSNAQITKNSRSEKKESSESKNKKDRNGSDSSSEEKSQKSGGDEDDAAQTEPASSVASSTTQIDSEEQREDGQDEEENEGEESSSGKRSRFFDNLIRIGL